MSDSDRKKASTGHILFATNIVNHILQEISHNSGTQLNENGRYKLS